MSAALERTAREVVRDTAITLTFMIRRLAEANDREALPPDFREHQEDLKSARGTIERVSAALRATLPQSPLCQPQAP